MFLLVGGGPALFVYWYNEGPPILAPRRVVLTPEVRPGDDFKVRVTADIFKECNGMVHRSVVDANNIRTEYNPEPRPHDTQYNVSVKIPETAAPGDALYKAFTYWSCNPVQRVWPLIVEQPDIQFQIIPYQPSLGYMPKVRHPLATATTLMETSK